MKKHIFRVNQPGLLAGNVAGVRWLETEHLLVPGQRLKKGPSQIPHYLKVFTPKIPSHTHTQAMPKPGPLSTHISILSIPFSIVILPGHVRVVGTRQESRSFSSLAHPFLRLRKMFVVILLAVRGDIENYFPTPRRPPSTPTSKFLP